MKIELYIDKQLCDIGDPSRFSVYLKRQLYNPRELSTKDAQVSYNITLPATDTNNAIFGFANVEEVKGKFVRLHDAQLVVDGIRIFDGKFRMNEITPDSYKGNLGVPAKKTVKDIFGDRTMNQAKEWKIKFGQFAESVAKYNNTPDSECIFPFVLYGLLPKVKNDNDSYSLKKVWDETVRLGIDDFPPSINCLKAIEHIFEGEDFDIVGTAFNDSRLAKLYMSYKNPPDYQMPWNYGLLGKMVLSLNWSNYKDLNAVNSDSNRDLERTYYKNTDIEEGLKCIYTADLLSSTNAKVEIKEDPGYNILKTPVSRYGKTYNTYDIVIPYSGLYKIEMSATLQLVKLRMRGKRLLVISRQGVSMMKR
ncbi:MAG: hypothetical protein E6772_07470 [Dysgonomonas sp.]|nr:hypothetical protein [Dysgonomonas sp.]